MTYTLLSRVVGNYHYYCQFNASNIQFWYGLNQGTQIGPTFNFGTTLTVGQTYTITLTTNQVTATSTLLTATVFNSAGVQVYACQVSDATSSGQNASGPCQYQVTGADGTHGVNSIMITNTVAAAPTVLPYSTPPAGAIQILLDSDQGTDDDDVADIGLCCALHRAGIININGIIISNKNGYGASCASALVKYALPGNTIQIGQYNGSVALPSASAYCQQITNGYGPSGDSAANYQNHITAYRKIFAAAAANSIVLICTGSMTSFMEFANSSADGFSPLTGTQLIQQKIKKIHWQAGWFQSSALQGANAAEYNINLDVTNSIAFMAFVAANIPNVDIIWTGDESPINVNLLTGFPASHNTYSPFNMAFNLVGASPGAVTRYSWGQMAINYAVYGANLFAPIGYRGTQSLDGSGRNTWTPASGQHSYLAPIAPTTVINASMTQDLIMAAPVSTSEIVQMGTGSNYFNSVHQVAPGPAHAIAKRPFPYNGNNYVIDQLISDPDYSQLIVDPNYDQTFYTKI